MNRIQKELAAELSINDIPDNYIPIAELIGLDNLILLCDYVKGDEIYLPQVDKILIPARNRRIRKEYDGYNKRELAQMYNLTIAQIGRIVKEV